MKTKSLILAAVALVSSVATTFATEEPSKNGIAVVPVKGTEVFKVIYKSENTGKVKLNIYNESGAVIFTETLNSVDGFIRPLNFSGLQNGEYTLELIDASGKRTEKISFLPAKASVTSNVHITKIASDNNNKFLVAVANKASEVLTVNIYDASENLIHTETKEISGNFAQVYSIKNLAGGVTFKITTAAGVSSVANF